MDVRAAEEREIAALPNVRVVGPPRRPNGLCIVRSDELYQLFVAAPSRGSGVAAALLADAEARLADSGVATGGSRAPSATSAPRDSMRNAGGVDPAR